jgi:UDP-glucuronate 4-epimerase
VKVIESEEQLGKASSTFNHAAPVTCRKALQISNAISGDLGYKPTTSIDVGVPKFIDWQRAITGSTGSKSIPFVSLNLFHG